MREQALFRALKTKHETPKYGLIYHASLIGQAAPKNKGKMSRILAAKAALATRVDAMGSSDDATIGLESRAKVPHKRFGWENSTRFYKLDTALPVKRGVATIASSGIACVCKQ